MSNLKAKTHNSKLIFFVVILFLFIYFLFKNITGSVFIQAKDRINVVFYGENTRFFSFSNTDINYILKFPVDLEVLVPGGYGKYRIGALGKLVSLDKNPEILKKAFSSTTASFVDLYFYPTKTEIYYNQSKYGNFPSMAEIFLSKSNGNTLDRLFLNYKFLRKNIADYKIISISKMSFDLRQFQKKLQGNFYNRKFRQLAKNLQIIYKDSYSTAKLFAQMIDGEGIRVVDLSQGKIRDRQCRIVAKKIDLISQELSRYFKCRLQIGETNVSDIILELGSLEKEWSVK